MNDEQTIRHRQAVYDLRERFNAMRMTVGVLGMEDDRKQAAEWLKFIADAAADCDKLVRIISDLTVDAADAA